MSAERDCFKLMDLLFERKVFFEDQFRKEAKVLLKMSLREFMEEHPEVGEIRWSSDKVSRFDVVIGDTYYNAYGLQNINPQLSKCIMALEDKFHALKEIVQEIYGSSGTSKLSREDAL